MKEINPELMDWKALETEAERAIRQSKIAVMLNEELRVMAKKEIIKLGGKTSEEEAEHAEFNFERVRALLSIYSVLVSEIWQGQPHYRILMVLHGQKLTMSREEIKNTTGISGAFVLRAIQELAKVGLVEYDMDTNIVKLKKRLFPKKALEEK